jgi:hypothetical protein
VVGLNDLSGRIPGLFIVFVCDHSSASVRPVSSSFTDFLSIIQDKKDVEACTYAQQ